MQSLVGTTREQLGQSELENKKKSHHSASREAQKRKELESLLGSTRSERCGGRCGGRTGAEYVHKSGNRNPACSFSSSGLLEEESPPSSHVVRSSSSSPSPPGCEYSCGHSHCWSTSAQVEGVSTSE
eukprot:22313_1